MTFCNNDVSTNDDQLSADIQGNIVRGHNRLFAAHVFIAFEVPSAQVREWIRDYLLPGRPLEVTSAARQGEIIKVDEAIHIGFGLTARGFELLDIRGTDEHPLDAAFVRGSRHRETTEKLGDPRPERWPEFARPFDALLLLASHDQARLSGLLNSTIKKLEAIATVSVEHGHSLDVQGQVTSDPEQPRFEHFRYQDGVSRLCFTDESWKKWEQRELSSPGTKLRPSADPRRPLSCVLTKDPASAAPSGFGSYLVYRKLEQDVPRFEARVHEYAQMLRRRGPFLRQLYSPKSIHQEATYDDFDSDRIGAVSDDFLHTFIRRRAMGRTRAGQPWGTWPSAHKQSAPGQPAAANNFDYDDDAHGEKCPFYAHIRKMNPRGRTGDLASEKRRSIARRGLPYGTVAEGHAGLLFVCMQASIGEQFEFIQAHWANARPIDSDRLPTPGRDAFIGRLPRSEELANYARERHDWISETIDLDFDFWDFIHYRGGEYCFLPSLSGLEAIARPEFEAAPEMGATS